MIKTAKYLGFKILNEGYSDARQKFHAGSVLTISPNSYGLTTKEPKLAEALKREGLLVLDGVYFGLGYFLRTGQWITKNQGPEIFYQELDIQRAKSGRVFFLGSTRETLTLISKRMAREYSQIEFRTYSPPFKSILSSDDNLRIEREIKQFKPDVVMVGMTCPKQEIWIHQNIDRYDNIIFMAIGGVFDWFAGNYKELNPIWWKLRIGWLGRAIQRPSLLRRNTPNYLIYLRDMFLK